MGTATEQRPLAGARPLAAGLYGDLVWRRPGLFARQLQLEAGSEILARLHWTRVFSFEATAESGDGCWIIGRRRGGGLRGPVAVRDADTGVERVHLQRDWRGNGTARFAAGPEYAWRHQGFWRPEYFWSSPRHPQLVVYRSRSGWTTGYEMSVDPGAGDLAELPVLVLLGAYMMALISARSRSS